jgi:hypothetical protein
MPKDLNGGTDLGLSLMAVMSVAGIHSAISPSLATFSSFFSRTPEEQAIADRTLLISLGASTLTALGILLVFKRWTPAIVGQAAGAVLFGLGMHSVHSPPPSVSTMEEKRQEQVEEQTLQDQQQSGTSGMAGRAIARLGGGIEVPVGRALPFRPVQLRRPLMVGIPPVNVR